jgi:hypothetical protein
MESETPQKMMVNPWAGAGMVYLDAINRGETINDAIWEMYGFIPDKLKF